MIKSFLRLDQILLFEAMKPCQVSYGSILHGEHGGFSWFWLLVFRVFPSFVNIDLFLQIRQQM